jgi:hypothetical protein
MKSDQLFIFSINYPMKKLILAVLSLQMLASSNTPSTKEEKVRNLSAKDTETYPVKPVTKFEDNGDDTGWADFGLSIVSVSENDSTFTHKVLSTSENGNLGLVVDIPKKDGEKGFGQSFRLKSIWSECDNLLHFMAKLYNQKPDSL